jgi:MtN3 and saliva related transmembrane protein
LKGGLNMITGTDLIGFTAATLTTLSFVPQAIQTIRTKDTSGISLLGYCAFWSGIACWLCYGLLLGDKPIIIANVITLALVSVILLLKIKHG